MAIEVFNRYEHKYMLNEKMYKEVLKVMDEYMCLDSHNIDHEPYTISNIYYDTEDDYLIRNSLSKPFYKEKLRLRSYGVVQPRALVFLEIKKKFDGIVNKRRTRLLLEEAYDFLQTGEKPQAAPYMNQQVLNELEYFLEIYKPVPKLYLAYDRVAYFEKDNDDLRISFDLNIRSRRNDLRLEAGDYGKRLLDKNVCVMEIKTSFSKPIWLTNMLTKLDIKRTSFSKYGTEYKEMLRKVV